MILVLRNFLWQKLRLTLHPKKIYLQHYFKGVAFLGVFIHPYRIVVGKRTAGNFYWNIKKWNQFILESVKTQPIKNLLSQSQRKEFVSSINSYIGIVKPYNSYKLRKRMLTQSLSVYFWNCVYISGKYDKIVLRK